MQFEPRMRIDDPALMSSPSWSTVGGAPGQPHMSGQALGHAWVEWRVVDDTTAAVSINSHVALAFRVIVGRLYVAELRTAATKESRAACERAAGVAARYDALLDAHNDLSELLGGVRRFIQASERNERGGLASDGAVDSTKRLVKAIKDVLSTFGGADKALTVEEHAIIDTLAAFLPKEPTAS